MPSQNWEREKAGVKALGCAGTMLGRDFPPSVEPASCQEKLIVGGGVGIWVRETFFPTGEHVWRGESRCLIPLCRGHTVELDSRPHGASGDVGMGTAHLAATNAPKIIANTVI